MSAGNGQNGDLNFAVSLGAATHNRTSDTDFLSVVADIASDKWRAEIEHIRAIYSKVEAGARADGLAEEEVVDLAKDAIDELKKQLPAVLWSGTFAKRSAGALKEHNGLVHVDLDQLGSDREVWRNLIKQDRHTLFCTTSPSGQGLKVVYRCDPARPHLESFRAAEHHVLQQFGLTADPACKDVSRLCFVTWDPDAYLNLDAVPLPYPAAAPVEYKHAAPSTAFTGLKPGDDYDARGPWPSVLIEAGWTSHSDNHRWTRPNKTHGISATWDQHPIHPKRFYVFSSNAAPFEAEHLYKPWHIYALLKCGGDLTKAAKELYAQNYGDRVEVTKPRVEEIEFEEGGRNGDHPPAVSVKPRPLRSPGSFKIALDGDASILLGNRYLNRGDGAILSGTSGMGKSAMALQMAILWALGRACFGIQPNGPLRSLLIQSEDSDGDLGEMFASICHILGLTLAEIALVNDRVKIICDKVSRGLLIVKVLRDAIASHHPDLVWINPLQAFMDGDVTKSQDLGKFLREYLNCLHVTPDNPDAPPSFAYFLVHHTTKPPQGKDKTEHQWHEVMYDMAGGAELINWARAILSLRATPTRGEFNLVLAKRGLRAGVTRTVPQGAGNTTEAVTTIPLKHAQGRMQVPGMAKGLPVIFWEPREPDPKEIAAGKNPSGRRRNIVFADLAPAFPVGIEKASGFRPILRAAQEIRPSLGRSGFDRIIDEAIEDGMLRVDRSNPKQPRYYV